MLSKKGFSVARHQIAEGVEIDIYNLHKEAGGSSSDHEVRALGLIQLQDRMAQSIAEGYAVIMAGDWNLNRKSDEDITLLDDFIEFTDLIDVSETLGTQDDYINQIDRVLFINSSSLQLTPIHYQDLSEEYVDEHGDDLSDHPPILVEFLWETIE